MVLCFGWSNNFAQGNDSLQSNKLDSLVVYEILPTDLNFKTTTQVIDTNLVGFQRYNPVYRKSNYIALPATMGSWHKNIEFSNQASDFLNIGSRALFGYLFDGLTVPDYELLKAYSEFFYTSGAAEENFFRFKLANPMGKYFYVGLDVQVETGNGVYLHQDVGSNHYHFYSKFKSKNLRYGASFRGIYNKMKLAENGGLQNDNYYKDTSYYSRSIVWVKHNDALNVYKNSELVLNQYYNLADSINLGYLFWDNRYFKNSRVYSDGNVVAQYYPAILLDSNQTFDSLFSSSFVSSFGWARMAKDYKGLSWKFAVDYEYSAFYDGASNLYFNYLNPNAAVDFSTKFFDIWGRLIYKSGMGALYKNAGNNNIFWNAGAALRFWDNLELGGKLYFSYASPELTALTFSSNHYYFDNEFVNIGISSFESFARIFGVKAEVAITNITNFVYFDTLANPIQLSSGLNVFKAKLAKDFTFKNWGASLNALYQKANDASHLRLPELSGFASFYFNFHMFKKALMVQPGLDFTFYSSYFADSYDPVQMRFYLNDELKVENQYLINAFVSFKVKRARVFLAYNNLMALTGNYNFYTVAHNPMQDQTFKFGVSWRFHD